MLLGVLLASAFVAKRELLRPLREAELILRIVESDKDLTKALRPPREYKEFIWGVALSGPRLEKIIQEHGLYPSKYARDPRLAVDAMRDDMDVDIWSNYFDPDYDDPNEARTARVSITWRDKDPETALAVVRELAATIENEQADERDEAFRLGGEDAAEMADRAEDHLVSVRQQIVRDELAQLHATGRAQAMLGVELNDLRATAKKLERETDDVNKEATRVELEVAWEKDNAGIRFEMVEPGVVLPREGGGRLSTAITASAIVVVTVFLGSLLLGAFESRVREPSDVARLGLPLLGALPPFPGDRVGNLAARLRTEDRLRLDER